MSADLEKMFTPDVLAALDERMRRIVREARVTAAAGEDRGITAQEAADILGVKKWRVYEMIRRRALPAYHPSPKTLRLRLAAVREFKDRGACSQEHWEYSKQHAA